MSQSEAFWWSLLRAVLIASVSVPLSRSMVRWAVSNRFYLLCALLPLFVPDLLVGFTYRVTATRLADNEIATEFLYAGLMLFRIVALQVGIRCLFPASPLPFESLHTWKLNPRSRSLAGKVHLVRLLLSGPLRTSAIAWFSGALLCFQDFETAALVQVNSHPASWTVALFDARAANESPLRLAQFALKPFVAQFVAFLAVLVFVKQNAGNAMCTFRPEYTQPFKGVYAAGAVGFAALGLLFLVAWPAYVSAAECVNGLQSLWRQERLGTVGGQVASSYFLGLLAAVFSLRLASQRANLWRGFVIVLAIPILCGSLLLSLLLLTVFQLPVLNVVYDTWLPMVVGQTLLLLPRAWLLTWLMNVVVSTESGHSIRLLSESNEVQHRRSATALNWRLLTSKWLLSAAVLAYWAFWDVAVVSMLRPVRFEPAICRLYAEMHYDHTDTLMAMTAMSVALPLLLICITVIVGRTAPVAVLKWGRL